MCSHILLITVGTFLIVGGFWGSAQLRKPYDVVSAWCAPVGLLGALMGIVLLIIPHFFA
jgi:hypothetical protein